MKAIITICLTERPQLFCSFHRELALDQPKSQEGFLEEELMFVESEEAYASTQQNTGCPQPSRRGCGRASAENSPAGDGLMEGDGLAQEAHLASQSWTLHQSNGRGGC